MKKIFFIVFLTAVAVGFHSVSFAAKAEAPASTDLSGSSIPDPLDDDTSPLDSLKDESSGAKLEAVPAAPPAVLPTEKQPTPATAPASALPSPAVSAPAPVLTKSIPLQTPVRMRIEEAYDASGDHTLQTSEIKTFLKFVIGEVKAKGKYKVDSDVLTVQDTNGDGFITSNELAPFESYVR